MTVFIHKTFKEVIWLNVGTQLLQDAALLRREVNIRAHSLHVHREERLCVDTAEGSHQQSRQRGLSRNQLTDF